MTVGFLSHNAHLSSAIGHTGGGLFGGAGVGGAFGSAIGTAAATASSGMRAGGGNGGGAFLGFGLLTTEVNSKNLSLLA